MTDIVFDEDDAQDPKKAREIYFGEPVKPETPASAMSMWKQYNYGFNEMLAGITGVDAAEEIFEASGMFEDEELSKTVFRIGGDPQNAQERVVRQSGQATAASVISTMGMAATSLKYGAPLVGSTKEQVMHSMIAGYRSNPMSFVLWDALSAATSEAARASVEEAGGGSIAQTTAAMTGAVVPQIAYTVGTKIPMLKKAYSWLIGKDAQARAYNMAAHHLNDQAQEYGDELQRTYAAFRELGVVDETGAPMLPGVAEASGSPALIAKQVELEKEAAGDVLTWLVQRKLKLSKSIKNAAENLAPDGAESRNSIAGAVDSADDAERAAWQKELDDIDKSLEFLTSRRMPEADRVNIGNTLREVRDSLRREVGEQFSERADKIGLNNVDGGLDATPFLQEVDDVHFNNRNKFASREKPELLKVLRGLLYDKNGKPLESVSFSFEDVKTLRRRLNEDINTYEFSDRAKFAELIKTKEALDSWFKEVDPPPTVNPKDWQEFRADYQKEFIQRFDEGIALDVARKRGSATFKIKSERVADAFLDSETTAAEFIRLYSDPKTGTLNPEAKKAISAAWLDKANEYAVRDGVVNEKKLNEFIRANRRVLSMFPHAQRTLLDTKDARQYLSDRTAELALRQRTYERSAMAALTRADGDYMEVIGMSLKDPRKMKALVQAAEDAGLSEEAIANAVWEQALEEFPEIGLAGPEGIGKFLSKYRRSLNIALGEGHVKALENIHQALIAVNRTPLPQGSGMSPSQLSELEQRFGTSIPSALNRGYAMQSGRVQEQWLIAEWGIKLLDRTTKRKADALMRQALFDRNVAQDLNKIIIINNIPKPIERRLNTYLFNLGFGGLAGDLETAMDKKSEE